jgi:hypothetical protein
MKQLSPTAEVVLNAGLRHVCHRYSIAAALRAAADRLGYGDGSGDPIINEHELLAIADELEAE